MSIRIEQSTLNIVELVRGTIRKHALARADTRVLVALSGGPDSVALAHVLLELQRDGDLVVAGLAHFNHRLRGAEADADETFCRSMAAALNLPIDVETADVRRAAREVGRSVEDMARSLRYAFLERAADRVSADAVAVGHSRDDQAETFLLRLMRGSGSRGLAGILPRAGRVIRPLLDVPRLELRGYAAARGLTWREDATNADLTVPRNRVRHELIPYVEREFNPGISSILAREAALAREDDDCLQRQAIDLARTIVLTTTGGNIEVDIVALRSLDPALASRVARVALATVAPRSFVGYDQIDRFLLLAHAPEGTAVDMPGLRATRFRNAIVIGPAGPRLRPAGERPNSFRVLLSIPGEVTLDKQGWAVSALPGDGVGRSDYGPARGVEVAIATGELRLPLAIRSRQRGDRFRPLGMGHRKKLQDFFVDRKIPREIRDSIPLVVDGNDRIVWVVGETVAEEFRVTEPSRGVLLLKARRLGGLG